MFVLLSYHHHCLYKPCELDYCQVVLSLCDILTFVYRKFMDDSNVSAMLFENVVKLDAKFKVCVCHIIFNPFNNQTVSHPFTLVFHLFAPLIHLSLSLSLTYPLVLFTTHISIYPIHLFILSIHSLTHSLIHSSIHSLLSLLQHHFFGQISRDLNALSSHLIKLRITKLENMLGVENDSGTEATETGFTIPQTKEQGEQGEQEEKK